MFVWLCNDIYLFIFLLCTSLFLFSRTTLGREEEVGTEEVAVTRTMRFLP